MFIILFILFLFIFDLIGMELYANEINFDSNGNPFQKGQDQTEKYPPRANFDNIWNGLTTIFIVAVGDDWNKIMYDYHRALWFT